jgi:hypothetical protein
MTKRTTTTTDRAPANGKKKNVYDDVDDDADDDAVDDPRSVRFIAKDIAKTVAWSGFLTTMSVLVGVVSAFDAAFPSVLFREKKRARKSGIARGWRFKNGNTTTGTSGEDACGAGRDAGAGGNGW